VRRRTFLAGAAIATLGACTDTAVTGSPSFSGRASPLPSSSPGAMSLDDVLRERRSVRSFTDEAIGAEEVAHLLWSAQGRTADWGGRTAPSAGALYPLEVYAATADGFVRYVADGHRVEQLGADDRRGAIADAVAGDDTARGAPALFVVTAVVARTAAKYGDRAERYAFLEAGHACQNLLLGATALGLGAVPMGAFDDDGLRSALGVGDDEQPLYVVPVGRPAGDG
jgi:SagB-type dehydrogenase family enzyme